MKWLKIEDYKTSQILLLLVVIILVFPVLMTLPAVNNYLDFSTKGEIGDTIGGITAPFINGLAAILVFIAFKAQIKANEIFKNQEKSRNILDQITLIQEDKLEIEKMVPAVKSRLHYLKSPHEISFINLINKVLYFTSEVHLAYELILEYEGEKDFLFRKLYYLYVIRYKDILVDLESELKRFLPFVHSDYEKYVTELLFELKYLNKNFEDVNRYKGKSTNI
jgi:hypothetical protein